MQIFNRQEVLDNSEEIISKIKQGAIFIYPTDTIYGIGCNALDERAVAKIRAIKNRPSTPLSVWVPSIAWIEENCKVAVSWLEKLPGPYTLILPLKKKNVIAKNVSFSDTLGVRLPDHWFSELVAKTSIPIVTTSVNVHGEPFMTSIHNLNPEIEVDFIIYEGPKEGRPSKIIDVSKGEVKER